MPSFGRCPVNGSTALASKDSGALLQPQEGDSQPLAPAAVVETTPNLRAGIRDSESVAVAEGGVARADTQRVETTPRVALLVARADAQRLAPAAIVETTPNLCAGIRDSESVAVAEGGVARERSGVRGISRLDLVAHHDGDAAVASSRGGASLASELDGRDLGVLVWERADGKEIDLDHGRRSRDAGVGGIGDGHGGLGVGLLVVGREDDAEGGDSEAGDDGGAGEDAAADDAGGGAAFGEGVVVVAGVHGDEHPDASGDEGASGDEAGGAGLARASAGSGEREGEEDGNESHGRTNSRSRTKRNA
jgi:hypothetical protein